MDFEGALMHTVIECIWDAVRLELDGKPSEREERLRTVILNTTTFQGLDADSWGRDEQALVDWTLEAFAWVASIRRVCREFLQLSKHSSETDNDPLDLNLKSQEATYPGPSFNQIIIDVVALRNQAEIIQQAFKNMKTRSILASEEPRNIGSEKVANSGDVGTDQGVCATSEEGELEQDIIAVRAAHWQHLEKIKEHMYTLEISHNVHVQQVRNLEHRLVSCKPLLSLELVPREVQGVVSASTRSVRQEVERLLIEIEDSLLSFKADEYTRIWRRMDKILIIISDIHSDTLHIAIDSL